MCVCVFVYMHMFKKIKHVIRHSILCNCNIRQTYRLRYPSPWLPDSGSMALGPGGDGVAVKPSSRMVGKGCTKGLGRSRFCGGLRLICRGFSGVETWFQREKIMIQWDFVVVEWD